MPRGLVPAGLTDLGLLWLGERLAPFQLWGFWDLPRPLDADRLAAAAERLVARHPLLGCRLRVGRFGAAWVPLAGLRPADRVRCTVVDDRAAAEAATARVVETVLDVEAGPIFAVRCFEWGGGGRLVLHVHHCLVDGFGFLRLMEDLAAAYADPGAFPASPLVPGRTAWQVGRRLRPRHWLAMPGVFLREQILRFLLAPDLLPFAMDRASRPGGGLGRGRYAAVDLPPEAWRALHRWCLAEGVTLNDYLMTATLVALAAWNRSRGAADERAAVPLGFASNFRLRYAPQATAVANLSATHPFWVPLREIDDVPRTLPRVRARLDALKRRGLGLDSLGMSLSAGLLPFALRRRLVDATLEVLARWIRRMNALTNIGPLPERAGRFGPALLAERCAVLAPMFAPPTMMFTATTYRDRATLLIGYDGRGLSDGAAASFAALLEAALRSVLPG
jgi:NRPS condensation-like uncharacterized protein